MCTSGTSFIQIAEAAKLLETTEMRVLMMIKKNELQGKLEDESWYVNLASLQQCSKPQASDIVKPGGCGGSCGGGSGSNCGGH